ncbi:MULTISPECIES: hypothetical protein [unclassified Streptomyces]|uniref:hypothetical protein n=1 Tax=unclassified Streptomyces TaxID=2593676 RepID=UPI000AAA63F0|nr:MULTISPECIES: hypothetical protein [unclassified Streptomyces]
MARIRTIKPDFFTSLTIADLTPEQRLTFIGLWTHCDDEGRCVDDPRLIKAAVWPLDDRNSVDVEIDLKALSESSLILRYTVNRKRYLAITNWFEHQRINRPTASKLPAFEDGNPTPPSPPPIRDSPDSRSAHGGRSEDSNASHPTAPEGSNPSDSGPSEAAAEHDAGNVSSEATPNSGEGGLTWDDVDEDTPSLSAHAQLTEGSRQERKGKEGNREGKGNTFPAEAAPERDSESGAEASDAAEPVGATITQIRPDVEQACLLLAELMEANGCRRPAINKEWRDAARLLLDKDGVALDDVLGAIRWSQANDFWMANIHSMPKLRKQYDTLRLQAQRGRVQSAAPTAPSTLTNEEKKRALRF